MRSVPQAMIWEIWRHGRLQILAGLLGANLLPVLLFAALARDGAIDPHDPSQIVIQIVLLKINLFTFAAAMFSAQGGVSRLYALPVTTAALVTWHLLPMMAAVGLESVLSCAALNALFGLDWPIWGPALYGMAWAAALAAALWLTENTAWLILGLTVVVPVPLGLWFKARYGSAFSKPTRIWYDVTFSEVFTMLVVATIAYYVAVLGVSRSRRGESLPSLGIIAWLNRLLDPAPYSGLPFRSPADAQSWFEWRQKGLLMPVVAAVGAIFGTGIGLLASHDPAELMEAIVVGGGLLSAVALLGGLIMGNCGPDDANYGMSSFLATRPMTNTAIARTIVKTAAKSVLIAWLIWAATFATVYVLLWMVHSRPPVLPRGLTVWYFPATLFGAWTVLGVMASLALTGRARLVVSMLCALVATSIGLMLFAKFTLSQEVREGFLRVALSVSAVLATMLTGWTFLAARQRHLIGWTTLYVAGSLWAALAALIAVADVWHVWQRPALYVCLVGIGALAVVPLAAAPLAMAWNRTR